MYSQKGNIFNIQRFSTSDGPGIRTVVFLKGCTLNCSWCHNPESKNILPEILYKKDICISCKKCLIACNNNCHHFEDIHIFDRKLCNSCHACTNVCPSNALQLCGEEKSIDDIMKTVLRDVAFYDETGGGLTISGGEPLMQYDFTLGLLMKAKEHKINTAIETSGFSAKALNELNAYTDLWLYDIKLFNESEHIKHTGVSNKNILKNLYFLDSIGAKIILRCPIIPDINTTEKHFDNIAALAGKLKNISSIHLELYHPLGISKSEQLNLPQIYKNNNFLNLSEIMHLYTRIKEKTNIEVIIL